MKTIELNGETYTCTLTKRFRRHKPEELEAMRETIADPEIGIKVPIRIYHDTTLNLDRCILDGEGRLGIAVEVGADVPLVDEGKLTTEEAYERAKLFNDARRQDDPEAVRKRRIERVAAAKASGKSERAIAEAEGVSKTQVRRDLADAQVVPPGPPDTSSTATEPIENGHAETEQPQTPPPKPPKVTGRDGKEYPSTKPEVLCKTCQRKGPMKDCPKCEALRNAPHRNGSAKKKPPKSGSPVFDDRPINDAIGKLARMFNDRAKARKEEKSKGWADVRQEMEHLLAAWDRWRLERASA